MKNIKDYNLDELQEELINMGEKKFRAEQIFKWIYKEKVKSFDEMTNLSIELREKLKENYTMCNYNILKKQESKDGTKKYLFDVLDGNAIETVLMQYHHGKTVCVSSQIGCKMGCKFCASTGIQFVRNLTAGEIVEQILAVEQDINDKISNIVFMGIGEPLDNYDNVIKAIKIMNNPKGLEIGTRHISISTSGLVPRIYDLANEKIQCTLSISLHATTDEKRSSMMPVNNRYNIEELMKACKDYIKITNKRISFDDIRDAILLQIPSGMKWDFIDVLFVSCTSSMLNIRFSTGDKIKIGTMTTNNICKDFRLKRKEMYMYYPKEGAWFSLKMVITSNNSYNLDFNYDNWDEIPSYFQELDWILSFYTKFPRSKEYTPLWLRKIVGRRKLYLT